MKIDETVDTISLFFNDLIGSIIPGAVLAAGLSILHVGLARWGDITKLLESTTLMLAILGLMFAVSHTLMAVFEFAIRPLLRRCKIVDIFDEVKAKKLQSYLVFAEIVNKLKISEDVKLDLDWTYKDLRNVALSVSLEGASLGRRFMFISHLCNGVGAALVIILVDFLTCLVFNPKLLVSYPVAMSPTSQSLLFCFVSIVLFKRGMVFHRRAMTTPFSIAVAELKLKREKNVSD